jgi:hypothetical protein
MSADENGGCPEGQTADGLDAVQGIARTVPQSNTFRRSMGTPPFTPDVDTLALARFRDAEGCDSSLDEPEATCHGTPMCAGRDVQMCWYLSLLDRFAAQLTMRPHWRGAEWCAACRQRALRDGYLVVTMRPAEDRS